jgi:hypothetical protein
LWTRRIGSASTGVRGDEPGGLRAVEEPLQDAPNVAGGRVEALVLLAPDDGPHVFRGDVADRLDADGRNDRLVEVAAGNREVLPVLGHHFPEEALAKLGHGGVRPGPLLREPLLDGGRLALRDHRLALVALGTRELERQRRVATQRHPVLLAVQPVPVAPERAAGRERLEHETAFVGPGVAGGLAIERANGGVGERHERIAAYTRGISRVVPAMCTHMCTQKRSAAVGRFRPPQQHEALCDKDLQYNIGPRRTAPEVRLLADAEAAEYLSEQVIHAERAGDLA